MITKQQFVTLMEKWKALEARAREIDAYLHQMCGASCGEMWWDWSDLVSDVMSAAMHDQYDWVPYFAYDRNFDLKEDCVYNPDDKVVPTHTWEDVYDLIVKESADG